MTSRIYIIPSDVKKGQTHIFLKTFITSCGWPYAGIMRRCLLWCFVSNCVQPPPARALNTISSWTNLNHDVKQGRLNYRKVRNSNKMWSCDTELCTNSIEASKGWVFIAHISIYSTPRCRCHTVMDIPRLRDHTLQPRQMVRTVWQGISGCAPTIH